MIVVSWRVFLFETTLQAEQGFLNGSPVEQEPACPWQPDRWDAPVTDCLAQAPFAKRDVPGQLGEVDERG